MSFVSAEADIRASALYTIIISVFDQKSSNRNEKYFCLFSDLYARMGEGYKGDKMEFGILYNKNKVLHQFVWVAKTL